MPYGFIMCEYRTCQLEKTFEPPLNMSLVTSWAYIFLFVLLLYPLFTKYRYTYTNITGVFRILQMTVVCYIISSGDQTKMHHAKLYQ